MADDTQHVVLHTPEEDGENGMTNIFRALARNPGATFQLAGFVVGLVGVYYAIEGEIRDVRAAQVHNFEQITAKLDALTDGVNEQKKLINDVYARGDTRYAGLLTKIGEQDVLLAKVGTSLDYLVKASDTRGVAR